MLNISQAAKQLKVCKETLRRWDKSGQLTAKRDRRNRRIYDEAQIKGFTRAALTKQHLGGLSSFNSFFSANPNNAVNEDTALSFLQIFAIVRTISEHAGSLPLHTYKRLPNGGKELAPKHPNYGLLLTRPNPYYGSITFRQTMVAAYLLYGNCYAEIERNGRGAAVALHIVHPSLIEPKFTDDGQLVYEVPTAEGKGFLNPNDVLHVQNLSMNGIKGLSTIQQAYTGISLAIATESFGQVFMENAGIPSLFFKTPARLPKEKQKDFIESFQRNYTGQNRFRCGLLPEGMEIIPSTGFPPSDVEFIDSRKFSFEELCRLFNIPPTIVGSQEASTYNNTSEEFNKYQTLTLRPILEKIENEFDYKLFPIGEQNKFFCEHDMDRVFRGNLEARMNADNVARFNGLRSINESRAREGLNPIDNEKADMHYMPLNFAPIEIDIPNGTENIPEPANSSDKEEPKEDTTGDSDSL